eukprot:12428368-Karenia_brevis.AAC.1
MLLYQEKDGRNETAPEKLEILNEKILYEMLFIRHIKGQESILEEVKSYEHRLEIGAQLKSISGLISKTTRPAVV